MSDASRGVLVLRALGLGDFMTAVPSLRALRGHHAGAPMSLAAPRWLDPLVRWTGLIDERVDVASLNDPPPGRARPDLAVNLHGSGPRSHRWLLATAPRRLMSFRHPEVPASAWGPAWSDDEHEVARWCRMLRWFGIDADATNLEIPAPVSPLSDRRGYVVVHPGAKDAARRWPPERWGAVAAAVSARGHRVVVTGDVGERPLADRVGAAGHLPACDVLAGKLDVLELAGLVAGARAVLCGDTGVAHLATAFARPSVVLFGPTPPWRWGPPPSSRHVVLWSGATGDPHGREPFAGLTAITVDEVVRTFDGVWLGPALRGTPR
jgi:ADP-heptose:LPS heptosyltransferase